MDESLRDIRVSLLEADVAFDVVKKFVARVREKAIGEVVKTNNNSLARYEKGSEVRGSPERIGYMIATLQSRELDKAHKSASEAASQAIVTACAIYAVTGYATVNSTRRKRGLAPVEYCANLPN